MAVPSAVVALSDLNFADTAVVSPPCNKLTGSNISDDATWAETGSLNILTKRRNLLDVNSSCIAIPCASRQRVFVSGGVRREYVSCHGPGTCNEDN